MKHGDRIAGERHLKGKYPCSPFGLSLILLLLLAVSLACGKKERPFSPDLTLPGPVRDLRVFQDRDTLVVSWAFPRENLLGQPLVQLEGFRLYRAAAPGSAPAEGCAPDFVLVADIDLAYPKLAVVQGETVLYRDRELRPGRCYSYRVAAYGPRGLPGAWSEVVSHAWGVLPRAPGLLTVKAGDREVQLSWDQVNTLVDGTPIKDLAGYFVYRRTPGSDWQRLTPDPLAVPRFHDVALENEVEYNYMVRAVRRLGQYLLMSLDSPWQSALPQDLMPPPPPLNLVAVPTSNGVELRWEPSPAPDLAGYRVYRRRAGEAKAVRLTPALLRQPYFVDTQAVRGQTYYYTVTAVDDSPRGNESPPSAEAALNF